MERITTEYGQPCNYLKLSVEDMKQLEPFLNELGIRCRTMSYYTENGTRFAEIQAENPFKTWIGERERKIADERMTPFSINCYKK